MNLVSPADIEADVIRALKEDLGGELDSRLDITACLIDKDKQAKAKIITRESGILCGKDWAEKTFQLIDDNLSQTWHVSDGDAITPNQVLVTLRGNASSILTAERTALNFLQFLSGTATRANQYARLLENTPTRILDTRKTIPGFRLAQKYAVKCGGGHNHRIGLFDAFLIKENHISACGGIQAAINKARMMKSGIPVEVEVETLEELKIAIDAGADIVMLDNFNNEQIQSAVALNNGICKLEVSGNITDDKLVNLAKYGVDFISSGAITKHVSALDLSLLID